MFWTLVRCDSTGAAQSSARAAQALRKLLPSQKELPPILQSKPSNLYKVLSRTPSGGVGREVYQTRWTGKNIANCYWMVTKTRFKCEGTHGKAWGLLYWKGKCVSPREERIRGSLKYTWAEGRSQAL